MHHFFTRFYLKAALLFLRSSLFSYFNFASSPKNEKNQKNVSVSHEWEGLLRDVPLPTPHAATAAVWRMLSSVSLLTPPAPPTAHTTTHCTHG